MRKARLPLLRVRQPERVRQAVGLGGLLLQRLRRGRGAHRALRARGGDGEPDLRAEGGAGARPPSNVESEQDELVWKAVSELVISIEHLEQEYEASKLEKKIREYFKKSAKNLEFYRKTWSELINDYADAVYEMLFQGLCGRPWLMQGEADLLMVLDAGVKEHFPPAILSGVQRSAFEQTVLAAHDRAFEEQRYLPILDEVSRRCVEGQKIRKKLNAAGEAGRREAADYGVDPNGSDEIEEFVVRWINSTLGRLAKETNGEIDWILTEDAAVQFFTSLMEADAVPMALTKAHAPPRHGWVFIHGAVAKAYATHGGADRWSKQSKRKAASMQGGWDSQWGYTTEPPPPPISPQNLPQCATPGCPFRAHSSPNRYAVERGWHTYCCNGCHEYGEHGPRCEKSLCVGAGDAGGG
eukprot:CAMPEP_0171223584 /NCGR_PEP_ID=MMETSP0790-20130122/35855_1 /TAXON_ID=2925 /ORGANISM="Alexandrium catenella, Strain OF101" /LENGTH=410 /DNA_ID=CAMNT_0011689567 /DNA_START=1 /DNA_END=1230 /DNA_ORIENTATION=+